MSTPPPLNQTPNEILTGNDRLWVILSHISIILGVGIILPLIVYLWKKTEAPLVTEHAKEALNFHLSLFIYSIACIPLCFVFIGFPLLILLGLGGFILGIMGTIKASDNVFYRYPMTIRMI